MKIKKMKIEYTFSQMPSAPKIHRNQYSIKSCGNCLIANTNNNYYKYKHLKPLINFPEKQSSINNKSNSIFVPQVFRHRNPTKQTDRNNCHIKKLKMRKNESRSRSIQHLSEQRFLDSEFNKLNEVIRKKLKVPKNLVKNKFFAFNPKSFDDHNDYLVDKMSKERSLSQPKYSKILDMIMIKKGRNKKSSADSCTQTYGSKAVVLKKSKSNVVDLSLFSLDKGERFIKLKL